MTDLGLKRIYLEFFSLYHIFFVSLHRFSKSVVLEFKMDVSIVAHSANDCPRRTKKGKPEVGKLTKRTIAGNPNRNLGDYFD